MQLKSIKQTFSVQFEYQLHFTKGVFDASNPLLSEIVKQYKPEEAVKLFFVIDAGFSQAHPGIGIQIETYCKAHSNQLKYTQSIVLTGGERSKNSSESIEAVLKGINDNAICRHSFVVAIGGGALIDMTGYASAIAHRGVKLIRIPTTVLAQNDAAVGVKNSVNIFNKKNFLGTFAPPFAIINDSNFLITLEQRDWISGVAEAIKVALIKDRDFYTYIADNAIALKHRDMAVMHHVIYKCAEMHMHHISQGGDPFESGSSRPLDFGHWAAHKIEYMTNYSLRHGEAVAKGIALDVTYAHLLGLISEIDLQHVLKVLLDIGFDIAVPVTSTSEIEKLLQGITEFQEHLGGELTITLISDIGIKHDVHTIDMQLMSQAITHLNRYASLNQ